MRRLFIDLETAPYNAYVWRCGKQFVNHNMLRFLPRDGNIICACWKWEGESKVHSLEWDACGDLNLMKALLPVLHEADEIVAQNGDRFDIPYVNTRILANGLEAGPIWKTVDTLVIARRRFKFPSNRLDALGKFMFGEGKIKTDFELWTDIKEKNCPKAMAKMVRYCKKDVRLLERVYSEMCAFHKPKTHAGVANGLDKWTCMHCGSEEVRKDKTRFTAAGTTQHGMQCNACHKYYTISDKAFNDRKEALKEKRNAIKKS